MPDAPSRRSPRVWIAVLVAVALSSALARIANHRATHVPGRESWVTADPDTHHMLRRVERIFREGLPPAPRDADLSFPDGSAIPGAPYYAILGWSVLAPFAPSDAEARRAWLEMRLCELPLIFGVCTSLLAAWIARRFAGDFGGLFAGLAHAFTPASINYSNVGNGGHRAFVTFVATALFAVFVATLAGDTLLERARSIRRGALAGALAGLALGAWPATLLHLVALDVVLGVVLLFGARRTLEGLAPFGFSFHAVALLVAAPAIAWSPWQAEHPWIVVNLSAFHAAFLALGAGVFVPLFFIAPQSRARALYPWLLAATLAAACAWIARGSDGVASAVRDGFAWVGRSDAFMAGVKESQPLFGRAAQLDAFVYLGWMLALLAPAWIIVSIRCARRFELALLPMCVITPIAFAEAATQSRFGDALVVPMLVTIVAALALVASRFSIAARRSAWLELAAALAAAVALEWSGVRTTIVNAERIDTERESPVRRAARESGEWLRGSGGERGSVLAFWTWGHTLQWSAELPIVASNYGAYVGEEAFRDPSRFFLANGGDEAYRVLDRRRTRWVLATSDLDSNFEAMCDAVEAHGEASLPRLASDRTRHDGELWRRSVGLRLLLGGRLPPAIAADDRPLARLRLVHVAPLRDPQKPLRGTHEDLPAAFVWEYVRGAKLEAAAGAGEALEVDFDLEYPIAQWTQHYSDRAPVDADGVARLTLAYATGDATGGLDRATNGDARVSNAHWKVGARSGALNVAESAVERGETVKLR